MQVNPWAEVYIWWKLKPIGEDFVPKWGTCVAIGSSGSRPSRVQVRGMSSWVLFVRGDQPGDQV